MSALGHKRTFAVQYVMSALPPKATAKADIGALEFMSAKCPAHIPRTAQRRRLATSVRCSLCPQKLTFTSLFEGLIGYRSNLRAYFARANDLGRFRGMQWTML